MIVTVMDRRAEPPRRIDEPEPGYYAVRMRPGAPEAPAEIVHRRGLWGVLLCGKPKGYHVKWGLAPFVEQVWTGGRRITLAEYDALMKRAQTPGDPVSRPFDRVDLSEDPPLF